MLNRRLLSSADSLSQEVKLKTVFAQGAQSPALFRLIESLDAFYDNEAAFQEYLRDQDAQGAANSFGLQLRTSHRIHPKVLRSPSKSVLLLKLPCH